MHRAHAQARTERSADPHRPRHAHGPAVPQLLDPGAPPRGAAGERLPAGPREAPFRAPDCLPRHERASGPDGRVLRPSRRVALVRPERRLRPALPLSRLEVRRHRPVRRYAVGAGAVELREEGEAAVVSARRARRPPVDLHGPARDAAAAPGVGVRHGARVPVVLVEAAPGVQLAAGARRGHRLEPRLVPAPRRPEHRSALQGGARQPVQPGRPPSRVRGGRERGWPLHRRPPQHRGRPVLLAHHAVGDAVVHDDRAARQPFHPRPLLDPD